MNSNKIKHRLFQPVLALLFLSTLLVLAVGDAYAHRVNVFAWVEGDTVYVESKFSGGRKVKNGDVIVTDAQGVELLAGKTNDEGEFSFKIPRKTELKIILEAGEGHRGEWTVPIEDIEASPAEKKPPPGQTAQQEGRPRLAAGPDIRPSSRPESIPSPSVDDIETAVEKALDKKLKPVLKMLAELQQKGPTVNDIFGGIGYILGLVGIATYFRCRKKKE